jgi:ribosomal protein S18 acetylase RimI-like enzyme
MTEKLRDNDVESCVSVIASAFRNDPLFTHNIKTDEERRIFSRFLIKKSLVLDENGLVVKELGSILGVASFEKDSGNMIKGLLKMMNFKFVIEVFRLKRMLSAEGFAFFNRYMRFTTSVRPKQPHYYLVFIGVAPVAQGRGIGRAILEEIHEKVEADPESLGIGLDTENEANVAYYEKIGYKLVETRTIDQVTVYAMFRENRRISNPKYQL